MKGQAHFQLRPALGQAWTLTKRHFWLLVGILVVTAILTALSRTQLISLLMIFVAVWLTAGRNRILLNIVADQPARFGQLFRVGRYYWRMLGLTLLLGLMILVGFLLLIVPGIYLAIRYWAAPLALIDRDCSIGEALAYSSRLTRGNIWPLLGAGLVGLGIAVLGALVLGIGLLWAVPVVWLMQVVIYTQLCDSLPGAPAPAPEPPAVPLTASRSAESLVF